MPSIGRFFGSATPWGSTSQTNPRLVSSHDSQVPQGVGPPAQFRFVLDSTRLAPVIAPDESKLSALTPPPCLSISLLET